MIYITLENKLWLKIDSSDVKWLDKIKGHFSYYVKNYWFMSAYKSGGWDGKVHIFDYKNRRLPIGLLFDLIKLMKKHKCEVKADQEVKKLYGNEIQEPDYNLKFYPRYYQKEMIEEGLKYKKGLLVSPTASGKSVVITYMVKHLIEQNLISKSLIIVPTTNLIEQFYTDMIDYGMDSNLLGKFYADEKDWDKPILISTWQSLAYDNEKIRKSEINKLKKEMKSKSITNEEKRVKKERYDKLTSSEHINRVKELHLERKDLLESVNCVIVDEVQTAKSVEVCNLMQKICNAEYRYGLTGTLPDSNLDVQNIKCFLGPIVKQYTTKDLINQGYLNNCVVHRYNIHYAEQIHGELNEVKDQVFQNEHRNQIIENTISNIGDENMLILVGRVEKEGKFLEDRLTEKFPDHEIKFIHGKTKLKEREEWRQKCIHNKKVIVIAVFQLFQAGINIPNLRYIMFASSYAAKVRTLQSIGRGLRKYEGKEDSVIIDIVDYNNKYLPKQAKERMKHFENEEFDIKEFTFKENG